MSEGTQDEFSVVAVGESPAPRRGRKPGRKAKARADAETTAVAPRRRKARVGRSRVDIDFSAELDGFGNPFLIALKPGWEAFWVSQADLKRYRRRRWVVGCWGDEQILEYGGDEPGKKGEPIKHGGLTLYLMRKADVALMRAADPFRRIHDQLKQEAIDRAENSEAEGKRGRAKFMTQEVTI